MTVNVTVTAASERRLSGDDLSAFLPLPAPVAEGPVLALFDFDGTLSRRETMLHWLSAIAGWPWTIAAALHAGCMHRFVGAKYGPDRRTRFKTLLLPPLLAGVRVERARAASAGLLPGFSWLPGPVAALEAHLAAGHRVVIATGAAPDCAGPLVEGKWGLTEVLGTQMEVLNGLYTGKLAGPNCVRAAKAEIVADFIKHNGPFGTIYGYGNAPHDLPMLNLCHHRVIVG